MSTKEQDRVWRSALNLQQARVNVAQEPRKTKKRTVCLSVLFGVGAAVLAGVYLARFDSVVQAQQRYEQIEGVTENIVIYDVACYIGPFNNLENAEELAQAAKDCLLDKDCRDKGSSWSHVFLSNGLLMVCFALNMLCIGLGAFKPLIRVIGAGFLTCLCFSHIAILISTVVYRFWPMGMLCGLSSGSTAITRESIDSEWTYEKDAKLIVFCFIIQLIALILFCLEGCSRVDRPIGSQISAGVATGNPHAIQDES